MVADGGCRDDLFPPSAGRRQFSTAATVTSATPRASVGGTRRRHLTTTTRPDLVPTNGGGGEETSVPRESERLAGANNNHEENDQKDAHAVNYAWTVRLEELEQASRQALLVPITTTTTLVGGDSGGDGDGNRRRERFQDLILQWSLALNDPPPPPPPQRSESESGAVTKVDDAVAAAVERMYDLYLAWKSSSSSVEGRGNSSSSSSSPINGPYVALLQVWASHNRTTVPPVHTNHYHRQSHGPRALSILQDWEVALGGDLEWAPQHEHYQSVLAAYASMPTTTQGELQPGWNNDRASTTATSTTTTAPLLSFPEEAADVAMEIVEHLEQSYGGRLHDLPNLQTYRYVVQCLSKTMERLFWLRERNSDNNDDNDDIEKKIRVLHEHLQTYMDKFLQQLQPKRMTDAQFRTMVVTLSEALHSWNKVQKLVLHPRQEGQSETDRYHHTNNNDNHNTTTTALARRNEWMMHWGRLVQAGNLDWWLQVQDENGTNVGLAVLEQTTMAILEMRHRDLLAALPQFGRSETNRKPMVPESCLGHVEAMTLQVLQLADMMEPSSFTFLPSGRQYRRAIQAWGHVRKYGTPEYVVLAQQQQLLLVDRMQEQHTRYLMHHSHPQTTLRENERATDSWNALLQAYLDANMPGRVKELWDKNNEVGKKDDTDVVERPTLRIRRNQQSFTILLQSLAAKREPDTPIQASHRAERAHAILKKLISHDPATRKFVPSAQHYASVMVAWSRSYHPKAAIHCQQVFDRLLQEAAHPKANVQGRVQQQQQQQRAATVTTHESSPFSGTRWSDRTRGGSKSGVSRISRNGNHQYSIDDADDDALVPTTVHYTALITTWGFSRLPGAMLHVLTVFQQMKKSGIKLDLSSYTAVLFALSRSQSVESAVEADKILTEMEDSSRYQQREERNDQSYIEPTLACYNSLLYAWCRSGAPDASERCEAVFRRLMAAYERSGWDHSLRPDSTSYVTLIDSISNQYYKAGASSAFPADRAEEILHEMEVRAEKGLSAPPDAKVYTAVMKAHWKSGHSDAALKVEAILRRMKESYEAGNIAAKPDAHAMTVLLQTWAKSDVPNKATIAWEIYKEMRNAYENGDIDMQPNAYSLSAVLNACAYTDTLAPHTKAEAVKVALMTMNELDNSVDEGLNAYAFRNMFQVIVNQIDDMKERTRFAGVIFQRCCQAGYVNKWTLQSLKKHVPALYEKLPAKNDNKLNLPEQWSRHVTKAERYDASLSQSCTCSAATAKAGWTSS